MTSSQKGEERGEKYSQCADKHYLNFVEGGGGGKKSKELVDVLYEMPLG